MDAKKPQAMPETSRSWVASPAARREHADRTTPAHVGECPVMTFTSHGDGLHTVDRPWERFTTIADEFFAWAPLDVMERRADGRVERLALRVANGWAVYRRVGRDRDKPCTVWEYVDGEYAPRQPGV